MVVFSSTRSSLRRLYRRLFQREEAAQNRAVVNTLREVRLFGELSGGVLSDLADVLHCRDYKRDEIIYYEGDPALGLYVVQRGRVRLLTEDDEGQPQEVWQVAENHFFGELSVLSESRRLDTAQAMTDVRLLGLFRPDVKSLAKRNPKVGAAVLAALARHLAARQEEMIHQMALQCGRIEALRCANGVPLSLEAPPNEPSR